MRWLFISSTAIWVTGSDTGSVVSRAGTELTSSKRDWTRIVDETITISQSDDHQTDETDIYYYK